MKTRLWPLALLILSCADDPEQEKPTPDMQTTTDQGVDRPRPDYRSWDPGTCWPPCAHTQYCHLSEGCAQQGPGVCLDRPRSCPANKSPVCGCDDATYDNDCVAHTAGVNVQYLWECGGPGDAGVPVDAEVNEDEGPE